MDAERFANPSHSGSAGVGRTTSLDARGTTIAVEATTIDPTGDVVRM